MLENNKKDYILISVIIISLILILYATIYIINYYSSNDILTHYPVNYKSNKSSLEPNEIGDSIGGILNPIIGLTASILTFLAFYIQFKANNEQRRIYNNNLLKEKNQEINNYKIHLRITRSLFLSSIHYYKASGENLIEFIEKEGKSPLSTNTLSFMTNSSYEHFNKLDFKEIYAAIVYNFKDEKENWEKDFTEVLTTMDFYEKFLTELKQKYTHHIHTKTSNINTVGEALNKEISDVLADNELKEFNGVDKYMEIVYNKDQNGDDILPEDQFEFPDINRLYNEFFDPFLRNLYSRYKETEGTMESEKYKRFLDFFSHQRKKLGAEKMQTEKYVENLQAKHDKYFKEAEKLNKVEDFLEKINIS